jgi:PTH1 family peptidyl-tRNA hydrolase
LKLVVGLGNPGKEYENTRHNLGFMFLDYLEEKYNFKISTKKFNSLIAEIYINNQKVIFAKPQTYMNLSGQAVEKIKSFYKIENENIMVIFDDLDIPFGQIRYKQNGSGGTHNGVKNIVQMLNTKNFPRIKIGIGGIKHEKQDLKDFVLEKFNKEQLQELNSIFDIAYEKFVFFLDN